MTDSQPPARWYHPVTSGLGRLWSATGGRVVRAIRAQIERVKRALAEEEARLASVAEKHKSVWQNEYVYNPCTGGTGTHTVLVRTFTGSVLTRASERDLWGRSVYTVTIRVPELNDYAFSGPVPLHIYAVATEGVVVDCQFYSCDEGATWDPLFE